MVPNAVDVDAYRAEAPRPDDLPPGPVVLYVGTLHRDGPDVELCAALATSDLPSASHVPTWDQRARVMRDVVNDLGQA
jgi:hypothetical protein